MSQERDDVPILLAGQPNDLVEERFLERGDDFCRRLYEIDQRFQNRLAAKVIRFGEHYSDGCFGIVVHLHRRGQPQYEGLALCLDCGLSTVNDSTAVSSGENKISIEPNDVSSRDQQPVFVDVVNLVEIPDQTGVVRSFVRLYAVENESLSLWEGLLYRRMIPFGIGQPGHKVLPRFVAWESYFAGDSWVADARKARPQKVHHAVEVVDRITDVKWKSDRDVLLGSNKDGSDPGIRIILNRDNARVVCDDRVNQRFDEVDVLFGPFNLKS